MSSILVSSISSGRGEFRYSSTFCSVFTRPHSTAALASGLEFLIYAENLAKMSIPTVFDSGCSGESFKYLGGHKTSSRNSSILFTFILTSLLKVINGGWVPGAKFCRSAGFLFRSTVVTQLLWAKESWRASGKRGSFLCFHHHCQPWQELNDGLFVLLLQPIQQHRQRHGQFSWAPRTAVVAEAVSATGLLCGLPPRCSSVGCSGI